MKYIKYILLIFLLICQTRIQSQTINRGQLSIMPGTEVIILDDVTNSTTGRFLNNGELSLFQDFTNNGLFSFSMRNNSGQTNFIGTAIQEIKGSQATVFYDVVFNNGTGVFAFDLRSNVHVFNEVVFSQGIINANVGQFVFEAGSSHNNASDLSHIDGKVQKIGSTGFVFPTGDKESYRNIEITDPANTTVFTGQYIQENSNTVHPHNLTVGIIDFIDTNEYWTLTRDQGDSDVIVALQWDTNTSSPELLSGAKTGIHIVRWDTSKGFWIDEGGIVDEATRTVRTITNVSGFGVFALARVKEDLILPGGLVVYNFVSPDSNGKNDFFRIDGIERIPNNTMEIFNRLGVKVYEAKDYNATTNVFKGFSDGRGTVDRGAQLPSGTYYYILRYEFNSQEVKKAGYLYISGKN